MSINCNSLCLLSCHTNAQMHGSMTASSIKIITKHNINVFAMYQFKSAMVVSCLDLCILGLLLVNTGVIKIVNKCMCDDRLLDCFHHVLICHKLWDV